MGQQQGDGPGGVQWADELPVLGIRVRFEATSSAVRSVVEAAFGPWRGLAPRLVTRSRVTVRFHVHDAKEDTGGHARVQYWMPRPDQLFVRTRSSVGFADVARGEAVARISRDLVRDADHFRYTFVEALTLFLVSSLDRAPFHCAALVRDGSAVLLSGPPGAGKSTLTYAALRRGFRVFAEDMVWLQRRPRPSLWGMVSAIHLPHNARRFFPELKRRGTTLLANGQRKVSVRLDGHARPPLPVTNRAALCLLKRSPGESRLRRIGSSAVTGALARSVSPGFDRFPEAVDVIAKSFARRGAWSLTMGSDPFGAVSLLEEIFSAERDA